MLEVAVEVVNILASCECSCELVLQLFLATIKLSDFISDVFFILLVNKYKDDEKLYFVVFVCSIIFASIGLSIDVSKLCSCLYYSCLDPVQTTLGMKGISIEDEEDETAKAMIKSGATFFKHRWLMRLTYACLLLEDIPSIVIGGIFQVRCNDCTKNNNTIGFLYLGLSIAMSCIGLLRITKVFHSDKSTMQEHTYTYGVKQEEGQRYVDNIKRMMASPRFQTYYENFAQGDNTSAKICPTWKYQTLEREFQECCPRDSFPTTRREACVKVFKLHALSYNLSHIMDNQQYELTMDGMPVE